MYLVYSAVPTQDFQSVNTQLIFTSGQTAGDTQCTNLQILDDSILESDETFNLQLAADDTSVVTITVGADSSVVTIREDPMDGRNEANILFYKLYDDILPITRILLLHVYDIGSVNGSFFVHRC